MRRTGRVANSVKQAHKYTISPHRLPSKSNVFDGLKMSMANGLASNAMAMSFRAFNKDGSYNEAGREVC
jgi:hypothetical protein